MSVASQQQTELPRTNFIFVGVILALALIGLTGRLWYLQLVQGSYFKDLSEHNRIRIYDITPARGMIYDRDNQMLVDNQPAFSLALVRKDVSDMDSVLAWLSKLIDLDPEAVKERLAGAKGTPPFRPVVIKPDLSWPELAKVETYRYEMPGLRLLIEPRRSYRANPLAVHLIGYTGEVTESQLKKKRYSKAQMGDRVGQYGLELAYEQDLSGKRGGRQVEVDATGRQLKTMSLVPAQPGRNLILSIDARLQAVAEEALQVPGALIALDPNTGQILAAVSQPGFDQVAFERGLNTAEWKKLFSDPLHPLQNRAWAGQYPPGSTFKIVTALAGLGEGVITPETTIFCPGHYFFGGRSYGCWKRGGHGSMNLHQALVQSCDVYFYQVGQKLGVDRIAKYSKSLGLGSPTGLGVGHERSGLAPTKKWKRKAYGQPWHPGETLSVSIGQGANTVTCLQMACLTAAVVNGGALYRPWVVLRIEDGNGHLVKQFSPQVRSKVLSPPAHLNLVREALGGVVGEPRGTGRQARVEGWTVGGKTGTAQVVRLEKFKNVKDETKIPFRYRDHAWFISFAPVDKPEIVVTVVVEHGGHGGSAAAPVAQKVLQAFHDLRHPPDRPVDQTVAEKGKDG